MFLRTVCGPDDIVTRLPLDEESLIAQIGARPASVVQSRIRYPWEMNVEEWQKLKSRRRWPRAHWWWDHMPAKEVRKKVDRQTWDSYLRFSIVRNPWDRTVSNWYFSDRGRGIPLDWFIEHRSKTNWEIISIRNRLAVDEIVRFENLAEDLARVCRIIGVPEPTSLPRLKTGHRPPGNDYREVLTRSQADRISQLCKREIEMFEYEFDSR